MRLNIRLRTQNDYVQCTVSAYKFVNPYSEQFEYVVATHQIHTGEPIDDPNMGPGSWFSTLMQIDFFCISLVFLFYTCLEKLAKMIIFAAFF